MKGGNNEDTMGYSKTIREFKHVTGGSSVSAGLPDDSWHGILDLLTVVGSNVINPDKLGLYTPCFTDEHFTVTNEQSQTRSRSSALTAYPSTHERIGLIDRI